MAFSLPKLAFEYNALEPFIDAKTMEIHHSKHHQTYTDKFNAALEKHPELFEKNAEELLKNLHAIPEDIRNSVKNHGGGYVNHSFFWQILAPPGQKPSGKILEAIKKTFGSYEEFVKKFNDAALNQFGSGWAWLVLNSEGKLEIVTTANQDSPLTLGKIPLLTIDVWEHAYYLKYQNRRAEYVAAFWNVVNWKKVEGLFTKAKK
jgi:Fe-Mn family superoxide dismutase